MRKIKLKKKITIIVVSFSIVFLFFLYYFCVMSPVIKTYTAAETRAITEKAVNLAVSNVINRSISYDSLIDITYNANGDIASFTANQFEINSITREIVNEAQHIMNDLGEDGLNINLGTFSGIPFLIGRGPVVKLKLVPIGAVTSSFTSQFRSVGINMTQHTIYLNIEVHVSIVLPIKSYEVYSTNQVMLAESVIVGQVPEIYLNGGSLGQSLNLVP